MDVVALKEVSKVQEIELPTLNGATDLLTDALHELDFLKYIDDHRILYYDEKFIAYSLVRYEKYWMPLLAKVSKYPKGKLNLIQIKMDEYLSNIFCCRRSSVFSTNGYPLGLACPYAGTSPVQQGLHCHCRQNFRSPTKII